MLNRLIKDANFTSKIKYHDIKVKEIRKEVEESSKEIKRFIKEYELKLK